MSEISREEVLQVAALARLKLRDEEVVLFQEQLAQILGYFKSLEEVDTSNIAPMRSVLTSKNVLRDDEPQPSLPVEKALSNAPQARDGFFVVPKVLEKG